MQRGTLNYGKTGITGTPTVEQTWTLDPTGNWSEFATLANGDATMTQTRTSSTVNEITAIGSIAPPPPPSGTPTPTAWVTPGYDAAGNMTTMPQVLDPTQSFTAVYDAWNRMVSVSASGGTVAQYQYDGRNRRIVKVTTYTGETRHFYFTNTWQDVEERVGASTSMDKQYVWAIRYVDELVCRDDATPERLYATQDANFNVTSITDTSGIVKERYLYDPYGNLTIMNGSWTVISSSAYSWSSTFQGLMQDLVTLLINARNRIVNSQLGTWLTRDPAKYIDKPNLYECEVSSPVNFTDPLGFVYTGPGRRNQKNSNCTCKQMADDQRGYAECIQAVDAAVGQELAQLDANYQARLADIQSTKALCVSGCQNQCKRFTNGLYYNSCMYACSLGCGTAFKDAEAELYVGYEAAEAVIGIHQHAEYAHCWSLFPCAVPESSGGDPYFFHPTNKHVPRGTLTPN